MKGTVVCLSLCAVFIEYLFSRRDCLTQLSSIQIGMTYDEVTQTLHSKGIDIGSGTIIQQYRSCGGVLYTFEYASTEVGFIVSKIIIEGEEK